MNRCLVAVGSYVGGHLHTTPLTGLSTVTLNFMKGQVPTFMTPADIPMAASPRLVPLPYWGNHEVEAECLNLLAHMLATAEVDW